jgi:Family of unknown function (DUF6529)
VGTGRVTVSRNLRGHRRWQDLKRWQKTAVTVSAAVQLGLAAAAWSDLARRAPGEVRGPKWRWAALIAVNYVGPVAYFRLGIRRPARPLANRTRKARCERP